MRPRCFPARSRALTHSVGPSAISIMVDTPASAARRTASSRSASNFASLKCAWVSNQRSGSADVEELHVEVQFRIRRNHVAEAARAVPELRRNDETAFTADFHGGHAFVPSLYYLADADR